MAGEAADWDFGRPVKGYRWEAERPRADIILQHGLGEYAGRYVSQYSQLIPSLNTAGFSVYAFDARGHGRSRGGRGVTDINKTVEDHLAARNALPRGGRPLYLFGHSMGGLITAASVTENQSGVAGVVLSAPALELEVKPLVRAMAGFVAAIAPGARPVPSLDASAISRIRDEIEGYDNDPMVIRKPPTAKIGATMLSALARAQKRFSAWQVPVLVLHGDEDRLVPVSGSEAFFKRIPADDKTLEIFQGGYHELLNDLEREKALGLILNWLKLRAPGAD